MVDANHFKQEAGSMRNFITGLAIAALIAGADILSKTAIMQYMAGKKMVPVTDFFNLVLVWNKGVSFSMLADGGEYMPYVLAVSSLLIVGILIFWLRKEKNPYIGAAIGIIIGGAIGNVYDRLKFGAVADFLDFHIGEYHWPAFNIADSAICFGAFVLIFICFGFKSAGKK